MIVVSIYETKAIESNIKPNLKFQSIIMGFVALIALPSGIKFVVEDGQVPSWFGMLIVALCLLVFVLIFTKSKHDEDGKLAVDEGLFKTESIFNISASFIVVVLALIYVLMW